MKNKLRFWLNRVRERLWIRPLFVCLLTVAGVFLAHAVDGTSLGKYVPDITVDSVETLLSIIASSMLVIATFAVSSMVSAYASASNTATPRSFALVLADDVSQNALSAFIGSFIFSIVALIAVKNDYYGTAGRFVLFAGTLVVFAIVIVTFVRWVDRIARLGRLGETIDKVEAATTASLERRRRHPHMCGVPAQPVPEGARSLEGESLGYVQQIDMPALQAIAADAGVRIQLALLPGCFVAPGRPLAFVTSEAGDAQDVDAAAVARAFKIGHDRTFDEDPRFGLIVLSEIGCRALSPGINDPGTAIKVIGSLVRIFASWAQPEPETNDEAQFDRISVPELSVRDMFDDAFGAIARDGAGTVEVVVRLLKALRSLATLPDPEVEEAAQEQTRITLARAEAALDFPVDLECARRCVDPGAVSSRS